MSSVQQLAAGSGLGLGDDWRVAAEAALSRALEPLAGARVDLLVLFASAEYQSEFANILSLAKARSSAEHIVGCSASAVIANARELEDDAGVAALALSMPAGAHVSTSHIASRAAPG